MAVVVSTKRITLQIPLTITGRDEHGSVFADHVVMENVSKDGGCLLFSHDLRRKQSFKIEGKNGTRFLAQVRWCMYFPRRNTRRVGSAIATTHGVSSRLENEK